MPRDRELEAGTAAHYEDPAYYTKTYRARVDDVRYYVARALQRGGPVLEYGCGNGRITLPLARAGVAVTGVDRSAPMLADLRARLRAEPAEVQRLVALRRGDMRAVRLGRRFSLVLCPFNAFLHLYERRDVERFLARAREHLAPRGELVLDVSMPDPAELARDPARPHFAPRFRYPEPDGKGPLVRYAERFDYDRLRQVLFVTMEFSPIDGSEAWMTPLAHRQFYPQELLALLHYNGFAIAERHGDFFRGPLLAMLADHGPPLPAATLVSSELDRIALLQRALSGSPDARVMVGIGDDAAVLAPPADPLVWTVDAAVEGVHFRRDLLGLDDLGYRATMAAASDLAAMGAAPLGLLAALVLPPWVSDGDLEALAAGQRLAAVELCTAVIGGNLARGAELSITTTALGSAARPLTRAGARPGEVIWMAGPVGLAAAGLAALERGGAPPPATASAVAAWRRPRARLAEGLRASGRASAAIDVSDGLARDVGHLARASGVRAVLDAAAVVSDELRAAAASLGRDPLALALHGGEDYALVVVLPAGEDLEGFARIGAVEPWTGGARLALRGEDGVVTALDERGFDHFGAR